MTSKRKGFEDIYGIVAGAAANQVSSGLLIYNDTKLYLDNNIKLKWKEVNETFTGTFGEDLKYRQVYVNIHKFGLYWIACRYPTFPCADMIPCIISHTDHETMALRSVSGMELATFWA